MAIIKNKTRHTVLFVAYRLDGTQMHQKATKIPPNQSRYVSKDYTGNFDGFIITVFLPESKILDYIDVDILPAVRDGDDALSFTKVRIEEKLVFFEDREKRELLFYADNEEPEGEIHGW
jgi:hypothetical protein